MGHSPLAATAAGYDRRTSRSGLRDGRSSERAGLAGVPRRGGCRRLGRAARRRDGSLPCRIGSRGGAAGRSDRGGRGPGRRRVRCSRSADGTPHRPPDPRPLAARGAAHRAGASRVGGRTHARRGSRTARPSRRSSSRSRRSPTRSTSASGAPCSATTPWPTTTPSTRSATARRSGCRSSTRPSRCGTRCTSTCRSRASTSRRGSRRPSPRAAASSTTPTPPTTGQLADAAGNRVDLTAWPDGTP